MKTWLLATLLLCAGPVWSQPQPVDPGDAAACFDRMSEEEKAALRERLKQFKALPLDEQARIQANMARFRALPPEEQARIRENLQAFQRLSPEERQRVLAQWRE
ncbi:MAG: DUF3106 domain-containing protein, partial [Myxococcaceae bacterium]